MTKLESSNPPQTEEGEDSFLWKQAWDYFSTHSAQRLTIFNFYIGLSSVVATGYFASLRSDSNFELVRTLLACLLCFFSFVFWKLDQRTKVLIKNAENTLKYFEKLQPHHLHAKVFLHEEMKTHAHRDSIKGWAKVMIWRRPLSYSDCFNLVYLTFFLIGSGALVSNHLRWVELCWHTIRRLV